MDYSTYYQPQPFVVFPPTPSQSTGVPSEDGFHNGSPNYDAFSAFDRDILAAQTHDARPQVYNSNGDLEDPSSGGLNRSSSEEKDMTPQQTKRKAQNRAAQRAFRERKERHVKELEEKLASLESTSSTFQSENEQLKRELQKISTENQILRATSAAQAASHQNHPHSSAPIDVDLGPSSYSPTDFYDVLLEPHKNKTPSHRITKNPETGEKLLGAAAAWDLITNDPLYTDGQVDIQAVSEMLKPMAKCDGQGPVFEESAIREAIKRNASFGKDELI